VAQLELHVDVGKRLTDPLPHRDKLVVDDDDPQNEGNKDAKDNPTRR